MPLMVRNDGAPWANGNGHHHAAGSTPTERIVARLEAEGYGPKPTGADSWRSRCPGHNGDSPCLSIRVGDNGSAVLHCNHPRDCQATEILAPLGLAVRDMFPPGSSIVPRRTGPRNGKAPARPKPAPSGKPKGRAHLTPEQAIAGVVRDLGQPTGCWIYPDADGHELMRVYRFDPPGRGKEFRPAHPDADGWRPNDPPGPLPLYRLPDLPDAPLVFVTEGEKAADFARNLGLVATTSSHGAGSSHRSAWSPLAGKTVAILPDVGPEGEKYAAGVMAELATLTPRPTVKVVRLPGLVNDGDDIEEWLQLQAGTSDRIAAELLALVEQAPAEDQEGRVDDLIAAAEPAGPPPFSLDLMDSETFFFETFRLEWLVDGVIVKDEPGAIGGPMKSLKTSILIDAMISMGSGTSLLGKFPVRNSRRCCLISGESGRRVIQANARQVCLSRGIFPGEANVLWGFKLPRLTDAEHMEVLRKTIDDNGIEVIGLDPFYLTILAGAAGIDASNMFQMGPLLQDVANLCLEEGCTPLFAHHFTKKRDDPFGLPELTDLAYAGIGQFIRQWMLVGPRRAFDAEIGKFFLHFRYGGSAGHCGEFAVDIEVGKLEPTLDSRKWVVTIASPSEDRTAKQEERKVEQEQKETEKTRAKNQRQDRERAEAIAMIVAHLNAEPGRKATVSRLRNLTGWRADLVNHVLAIMERNDLARPAQVAVQLRGGKIQDYPGYQLIGDTEPNP